MNYLDKNIENYKRDLAGLIKFATVLRNKEDWPTQEQKDALKYMEDLANRDGFKSFTSPEGYYGWIETGEGEEMIGLLAHIDVVSEGDISKWNTNPFELDIQGDNWYARGTQDDKGPLMLMYYLMLELKELGLKKRIRLIYPTDEESFWRGIAKYNELEEKPTCGFTPDATFPVTFLERESVGFKISGPGLEGTTIKGGVSINAVPSEAEINGKTYLGKAAHAMDPTQGENAIQKLIDDNDIEHPAINFIKENLKLECNGETLFGRLIKDDYAVQTVTLGMIDINNNDSMFTLDMRIPTTETADNLEKIVSDKVKPYGLTLERLKHHDKLLVDIDSELVKTLSNSFNTVYGKEIEPSHTGGGTYARAMNNTVAFGPLFPEEPITMHEPNEFLNIKYVSKAYDVYIMALKELSL